MIASRRILFFFLVTAGFLLLPLSAFAQVSVDPSELYWPPGEPSCGYLWYDYAPGYLEVYTPGGGPEYWWVDEYETYFCVDGWPEGTYDFGSAQLTVYGGPPPPPPPFINDASTTCDNWDCISISGGNFHLDSRVLVCTASCVNSEMHYGPALGMSPPMNVDLGSNPQGITLHLEDPNVAGSFGQNGLYVKVYNSDGTESAGWRYVTVAAPTITSGGPTCADFYCIYFNGDFPLSAYVDFRIPGQSQIINDYTDLVVTSTQITLRLNPSMRSIYDTTGLDAWVVNPSVGNWSSKYYLAPLDRSVIGNFDGIVQSGSRYYLSGWACARTYSGSIDVHVYAGGPAGQGSFVFSGTANVASEPAVAAACNSTGSNHRFWLQIPYNSYGGQPIYIHGISPFGLANNTIGGSGAFTMPSIDGSVTGTIEGVVQQSQDYYLVGWACARSHPSSIDVHVYVGGSAWGGWGTYAVAATANQPSDQGIAEACNSTGYNYRFSILLSQSVRQQFGGLRIYVHGISPFGIGNLLIGNSGVFTVPALATQIQWKKDHIYTPGGAEIVTATPQ
jgi:hypothetical protein